MGKIIFITGGVRSGKSSFAENYAAELALQTKLKPVYIATGVAFDNEMQERIHRHQQDRNDSGLAWETYEIPYTIEHYASTWNEQHLILFECVTTWLSNILFKTENLQPIEQQLARTKKLNQFKKTVLKWQQLGMTVLLISNEVLDAGISSYAETALYQQTLGELHQWLVQICDEAYEVNAQMIARWK